MPRRDRADRLHKRPCLLLNSTYDVLSRIDFNRALTLLVTGTAYTFESVPGRMVRGPIQPDGTRFEMPWPVSIILTNYRYVDPKSMAPLSDTLAANSAILRRDGYCCMYCGAPASTIDHVHPQSRGGENTWLNLVAACVECNSYKADRTPEEAGMELIREPFIPVSADKFAKDQKRVWKLLSSGDINVEEEWT